VNVGVLGGGQLGRMLALAGYPLGFQFRCLDPNPEAPLGHLADLTVGSYDDAATLENFARGLDLATYEFENVPVAAAEFLAARVPLFPPAQALRVAQDRLAEKTRFRELGMEVPPFATVDLEAELLRALRDIGMPAVLKTRRMGYDGKGQAVVRTTVDAAAAWSAMGGVPLLLEAFVDFARELSILAVRSRTGDVAFYPLVQNEHRGGILRTSRAPAPDAVALQPKAESYARKLLESLDYVGVLAIEFFEKDGDLLANEMAPRVHNSGHWTIEGAETSQFENHVRAVAGLPLGSTAAIGHAAMVNILGRLPATPAVLAIPGAHLHLYGKSPAPLRKLGHITITAHDATELEERIAKVQALLPD
jgi:5-(carboxyamino)imidazole ribonucleotide synthase